MSPPVCLTEEDNVQSSIESQNLPTCLHAQEISDCIDNLNLIDLNHLIYILTIYLENPILLDPFIGNWTEKLSSNLLGSDDNLKVKSCQILYQFCKIKGQNYVIKYFPNSTIELKKVFNETMTILKNNSSLSVEWTCRYIFILWMSFLIQCPFDLKKIFPNWNQFSLEFMDEIIRNKFLKGTGGKELEAASNLIASFLKRPEMLFNLENFLDWSMFKKNHDSFNIGILTTLYKLGKFSSDEVLLPHLDKINEIVSSIKIASSSESSIYKFVLKIEGRMAQINIQKLGLPIKLNEFISSLKHRDTLIRWTAAKTIRRILSVCEKSVKDQVSGNLLKLLHSELSSQIEISVNSLHGILLAIGQLLNYRLFIIFESKSFTESIIKCLRFDLIKGSYAVGSFVRDAACYLIWSLARYNSSLLFTPEDDRLIITGLTCMALFDREVGGRRSASASLQEYIGRIGINRQGSYLSILSHLHFFSVSALEKSYRFNALQISKELPQIVPDLIDHLLQVSLFNFDKNVRKLAAETLGDLSCFDPLGVTLKLSDMYRNSDDIFAMHGALYAMAALKSDQIDPLILEISLQADRIPIKSLGADILLEGHLKLISSIPFKIKDNLLNPYLSGWTQTISNGLKSRSDDLRQFAIYALQSISSKFGDSMGEFYFSILSGIEKERDLNYQKGLIAAISTCSDSFFSKNGNVIIKLLIKIAKMILPINDIEKRCVAIESIEIILNRFVTEIYPIRDCLINSLLCDYSIDTRGDVGSKIRLAALKLAGKLPRCLEIDSLILEQVYGRLDRLRSPAMALFFNQSTLDIEEFSDKIISNSKTIPLSGAFRGLIFSCGGLDVEISAKSATIIKKFISKCGSEEFEKTALDSLSIDRLSISVINTVTILLQDFRSEFINVFSEKLIESIISKTSNIRKLIPAFSLLINTNKYYLIGKYSQLLEDQKINHKFPVIRQLIETSIN